MKYLLLSFFILFASCAQVKYSSKKTASFDQIKPGTIYVVFGSNGFKKRLQITSVDENGLTGTDKDGNSFELKKTEIEKIRKNNTGGTVALSFMGASFILALTGMLLFVNSFGNH